MHTTCKVLAAAVVLVLGLPAAACAQEGDDLDPLGGVIADMQVAGGRLAKLLTDKPTQQKQQDAIDKLDVLIKELILRRGQGQGGASGNNPDEPLQNSMIVGGPGGSGPLHAADRKGKAWGQLPPHKRQQILQSMSEGFPAHYQQILERYYRRLADEKPASEATEEDAPVKAGPPASPAAAPARSAAPAAAQKTP